MTTQDLIAIADEYATQMVRSGNGKLTNELRAALLAALEAQQREIDMYKNAQKVNTSAEPVQNFANPNHVVPCIADPRAPHGFNRNASHSLGRYVCDCELWVAL